MDTDNDGVLDEFDKEINSPAFAAVDVFGVSMDSDKDGCLDFEDPEPMSSPILPMKNCLNLHPTACGQWYKTVSIIYAPDIIIDKYTFYNQNTQRIYFSLNK